MVPHFEALIELRSRQHERNEDAVEISLLKRELLNDGTVFDWRPQAD